MRVPAEEGFAMKERVKVLLDEDHLVLGSEAERVEPKGMSAAEAAVVRRRKRTRDGGRGSFILFQVQKDYSFMH